MKQQFNRRQFIISSLFMGLSLYIGGWWTFKVKSNDITEMIIFTVRAKLDYLQIDPSGLEQFAKDYSQYLNLPPSTVKRLSWMGMFSPLYAVYNDLSEIRSIASFSEQAAKLFLLSSDFFWHKAETDRVIKYIAIYNPYKGACIANPFAILNDS